MNERLVLKKKSTNLAIRFLADVKEEEEKEEENPKIKKTKTQNTI
jgi:hypothetical protein